MSQKNDETISHDDLAEWSGENTVRRFKFKVPNLKFNGNTGKFTMLTPDESGELLSEDITKDVSIVILKVRRVLSSYEKQADGSGLRSFTNEHNNWQDKLTVFEMGKGDTKPRMLDIGLGKDIREKFPKLRLRQNLYCLYNDQIVKLTARGKSLSSLFNYYAEFQGSDEHVYQFNTNLSSHEETNEGGLTYHVLDWERGKAVDLAKIGPKIKEVKENIDRLDKQFSDNKVPDTEKDPEPEEEKLEEVNVDDKPETEKREDLIECDDVGI